jgi:hypothetical protein
MQLPQGWEWGNVTFRPKNAKSPDLGDRGLGAEREVLNPTIKPIIKLYNKPVVNA